MEAEKFWYIYSIPHLTIAHRDWFADCGMTPYLPTHATTRPHPSKPGATIQVQRPLLFSYIFANGTLSQVEDLRRTRGITPLCHRRQKHTLRKALYLSVPDRQMEQFMQIISLSDIPVNIQDVSVLQLQEGDRVRISEGIFNGIEGTLLTEQGKSGGRVLLSLDSCGQLGILTTTIPPNQLQVLSFAPGTTHFYKHIQSMERLLDKAAQTGSDIDSDTQNQLKLFLWRFSLLEEQSTTNQVKLMVTRYRIHTLLGNTALASDLHARLQQYLSLPTLPLTSRSYITKHCF